MDRTPADPRSPRLAVLIDADNASAKIADGLFKEIAKLGEASVRRINGDFSHARSKGWADILSKHAIVPQQQFANTTGKNALFGGSDGGAEHWAVVASLIETSKLNGVEPLAYLTDVITRIVNGHPNRQIDDLLPWAYITEPKLKAVA